MNANVLFKIRHLLQVNICWWHIVSTCLQCVPSVYVKVAWNLAGFQTSHFINPSVLCTFAQCLMIFSLCVSCKWMLFQSLQQPDDTWLTPQNGIGAHHVYTKANLLKIQHRGMNPSSSLLSKLVTAQRRLAFVFIRLVTFYIWINSRNQLQLKWLHFVHAKTQNILNTNGL